MNQVDILFEKYLNMYPNDTYRTVLLTIFKHPIFTVKMIETKTNISNNTIRKYIKALEAKKLIYSNRRARNKVFYCYDLLAILSE